MDTKIVNIDKYRKCLSMVMLMCIKEDTWAKFVAKLNNTEAGMKKSVAYKRVCLRIIFIDTVYTILYILHCEIQLT